MAPRHEGEALVTPPKSENVCVCIPDSHPGGTSSPLVLGEEHLCQTGRVHMAAIP
jgi:hypothetical protein